MAQCEATAERSSPEPARTGIGRAVAESGSAGPAETLGKPRKADAVDKLVGRRLLELRRTRGMTQAELGRALDVRFQQIQRYENGSNRLAPGRLKKAAELFEVGIQHFFAEERPVDPSAADDLQALTILFQEIRDPNSRKLVIQLVEEIAAASRHRNSNRQSHEI